VTDVNVSENVVAIEQQCEQLQKKDRGASACFGTIITMCRTFGLIYNEALARAANGVTKSNIESMNIKIRLDRSQQLQLRGSNSFSQDRLLDLPGRRFRQILNNSDPFRYCKAG